MSGKGSRVRTADLQMERKFTVYVKETQGSVVLSLNEILDQCSDSYSELLNSWLMDLPLESSFVITKLPFNPSHKGRFE